MNFYDRLSFWKDYWTFVSIAIVLFIALIIAVPDVVAVVRGHRDGVGDGFTYTHWIVTYIGLSVLGLILGAAGGYLIAHFFVVHRNG